MTTAVMNHKYSLRNTLMALAFIAVAAFAYQIEHRMELAQTNIEIDYN